MTKTGNMPKEKDVREEFLHISPELDRWGSIVDELINSYLKATFNSPEHVQINARHRVKNIDSYCEKVIYRKPSENPILTTTDKVGTRVVLLTTNDVEQVSKFICECKEWEFVEQSRDFQHEIFEEPEIFSYQSDHFIVKPLGKYKFDTDKSILTCEIQVRTLLQHAYAEISHDTIYKHSSVDNRKAKRVLASSMALLEAADEKFIQIYNEINNMASLNTTIRTKVINLYKKFIPDYNDNQYNTALALKLLNIYNKEQQEQINNEIDYFVNNEFDNIKNQISYYSDKFILFKHPIVLVAMYGIMNLQTTTWTNWPFSYESLEEVSTSMNISTDSMK